jgi:hypothetical protein
MPQDLAPEEDWAASMMPPPPPWHKRARMWWRRLWTCGLGRHWRGGIHQISWPSGEVTHEAKCIRCGKALE